MELQTISQVSKTYGVSVRMLRYYEEEGLIQSKRKENYAYRVYDETAIKRLQQIIILRKLQIPVKQISDILDNPDASAVIEILKQSISDFDDEIAALSTINSILKSLVEIMQDKISINPQIDLMSDTSILPLVESLSFTKYKIKENLSMEELNKANETLNRLKKPEMVTFRMKREAFQFLGREYSLNNPDFGEIWGDFLDGAHGGYATLEKYPVPNQPSQPNMNIWHNKHAEHKTYTVGKMVGETDKVPDGFVLIKVPESEYFVITYEWVPANVQFNHHTGEDGNEQNWRAVFMPASERINNWECFDNIKNLQVPDGYKMYNDEEEGNKIFFIEVDNFGTPDGNRIEFWVPIKKAD